MQTKRLEKVVLNALEELKAVDVVVMDVKKLTTITDSMVVCTGTSNRHVKSLADNVVKKIKENKIRPLGVEGEKEGEWVLVDLGSIMVHIMQQKIRDFYGLEKLWHLPAKKRGTTKA